MTATDTVKEALREYVGDGDGADEQVLSEHDAQVARRAGKWRRPAWVVYFIVVGLNFLSATLNLLILAVR